MKAVLNKENVSIELENGSVYFAMPNENQIDFINRIKLAVKADFKEELQLIYTPTNDSDEQNPSYLFYSTSNDLLIAIAGGEIDIVELVKKELENRGYDENGKWIGFKK